MTRGIAYRRAVRETLIARYRRLVHQWHGWRDYIIHSNPNWEARGFEHPCDCDHIQCKSPRKWAKGDKRLTIQERRHDNEED